MQTMSATDGDRSNNHENTLAVRRPVRAVDALNAGFHPLQNAWTLWFYKQDRDRDWEENQNPIVTIETVEDFWALINNIMPPSGLQNGCDYSLFKKGIRPMWEDDKNRKGGRWMIPLDKRSRSNGTLDETWIEIMLCLIGELMQEQGSLINGAVVSIRSKHDRICLWLDHCSDRKAVKAIAKSLKEMLCIDKAMVFEYHEDLMNKTNVQLKI